MEIVEKYYVKTATQEEYNYKAGAIRNEDKSAIGYGVFVNFNKIPDWRGFQERLLELMKETE